MGESIKSISAPGMTERNGSIIPVRKGINAFVPAAVVVVVVVAVVLFVRNKLSELLEG